MPTVGGSGSKPHPDKARRFISVFRLPSRALIRQAREPLPENGRAEEEDGRDRRGEGDEDRDQHRMERRMPALEGDLRNGGENEAPCTKRRAQRRTMNALEKRTQPQDPERADQGRETSDDQERRRESVGPERSGSGHSTTSPRRRNFDIAVEPTKPNSAMRSAASKYELLR